MAEAGISSRLESSRQCQIRLGTFDRWPKDTGQTPERLAKDGFIHTEKGDEVECVYCGIRFFNWNSRKDPTEIHFDATKGLCRFAKKRMEDKRSHCYGSVWESNVSISMSDLSDTGYKSIVYVRSKHPNSNLHMSSIQNTRDFRSQKSRTEISSGFGAGASFSSDVATNATSPPKRTQTAGAAHDRQQLDSLVRSATDYKNRNDSLFISQHSFQFSEERSDVNLSNFGGISRNSTEDQGANGARKPLLTVEKHQERDPCSVTEKFELVSPKEPDASAMLAMSYKDTSFKAAKGIPDKYYLNSFMDTEVVRLVMKEKEWSAKLLREVIHKGLAAGEEVFTTAGRLTGAVYDYLDQLEACENRKNRKHDPIIYLNT